MVNHAKASLFDEDGETIPDLVAEAPIPTAEQTRVGELALDDFYTGTKDGDVLGACSHVYRAMRALEARALSAHKRGESRVALSITVQESDVWLNFKAVGGLEASLSVAALAEKKGHIIGNALRAWAAEQIAAAPLKPLPQTILLVPKGE